MHKQKEIRFISKELERAYRECLQRLRRGESNRAVGSGLLQKSTAPAQMAKVRSDAVYLLSTKAANVLLGQ